MGASYRQVLKGGFVIQTGLKLIGSQYTDQTEQVTLPAYTLWDATAEYDVLQNLAVMVGIRNILGQDQERWKGYLGVPRTAFLSGRFKW
jgi:outer membrane cobalamin receptor